MSITPSLCDKLEKEWRTVHKDNVNKEYIRHEIEKELNSRSVHVSNVEYTTTKEELEDLFERCGVVLKVNIPINQFTQTTMGYANIEFKNSNAVEKAIKLTGTNLNGRYIEVSKKITFDKRKNDRTDFSWFFNDLD
ncbi:RNA recognition motif domain containing protein [Entamoeba histolytica HM-1:IMSS-B]|uniref:RNA recognition motif domain containing protein n=6 Tax=Entamoeba histolytica TaxID=5759 RepID=C4LV23_ENTH1|nr:RNA recognition motif domain containing protein [Entamoeba histolytica HM-1:IMSS]EMD47913.1 RNA recognition domain containing protein [Entamoeba histolytica KU27]EMH77185.1 RNA recognition motif domain containing protein [Entamoeba histolytica HM-1:IMSS-B]EMS11542.1 RNA recognition motif domain containing protein [Entamoeba histolytica HM-3:IMSS]ENY60840.1 RNA recognition motif domain containing protein [Entamoeba histolytica HM-1:IMSS-A]GAT92497.1 RNA recognition motif domain containing pr|eukprot:XP_650680.1 RNA recognition motif domain containing protein [Entamoeba histolytica HM-1:IMSS]